MFLSFSMSYSVDIRQQMEQLISDSLAKSQNVYKAIKIFQQNLSEPSSSRIITRVKNMQLALIKNEYCNVYREHAIFVEKYEEKLKKILKREAQISMKLFDLKVSLLNLQLLLVSKNISIEETEQLIISKETTPSLFVGNVRNN